MNVNSPKSWHKQNEGLRSCNERPMNTEAYSRAVRIDGEVLVLRCWACGTEHYVNVEQCTPEELPLMICSKSDCKMSLFLVNELTIDEQTTEPARASEWSSLFAAFSRWW
jgi:hypothetical protein